MKTIIAPTDFSEASYNASLYAAKMAADLQAQLILLHVMELPVSFTEYPVVQPLYDEVNMEEDLKVLKQKLLAETGEKVMIHSTNILGSVQYELKELCCIERPFAVVMGTHCNSMFERLFMGSTTVHSARHLPHPVLIVPPGVSYKPIRKIALASDMKDIYNIPLNEIAIIQDAFHASLQVFHVNKKQAKIERASVESLLLEHLLQDFKPEFFSIEHQHVEQGVAALAEKHGTDLVLIMPRTRRLFHKTRSNDFIFYSRVPVMAIHEEDLVDQAEQKIYS